MSRTTDFFIGEIERGRRENRKLLNEIDRLQVLIDDLEAGGDEEDKRFMDEMQGLLDHALDLPPDPSASVKVDIIMEEGAEQ